MPDPYQFPPRGRRDDPFAEIQMVFDKVRGHFASRGPSRINPWLIALILLLVYLATGIYIVAPDERGIVLRFGRVVREADPGPGYHLPWPFEEVLKPPVTQILKEEFGFRTVSVGPPARYQDVEVQEDRVAKHLEMQEHPLFDFLAPMLFPAPHE